MGLMVQEDPNFSNISGVGSPFFVWVGANSLGRHRSSLVCICLRSLGLSEGAIILSIGPYNGAVRAIYVVAERSGLLEFFLLSD